MMKLALFVAGLAVLTAMATTFVKRVLFYLNIPSRRSHRVAAGVGLALALACLFAPFRAWATEEGGYIYHWFFVNGPATVYTTNTWKDAGGTTHTGLEINTGKYKSASALSMVFIGAQATASRTACSSTIEGQFMYDTTIHSQAYCDGANWWKLDITVQPPKWTEY